MRYCPNCGAQCPDGTTFCSNCGASLQGGPQPGTNNTQNNSWNAGQNRTHGIIIRTRMRGTIRTRTAQDIIIRIRESLPEVFLSV